MRVALIFQDPESGWRRHTELYHKDSVQVETICRILKKNGMPVSVWNCLNAYIGNRQYKAQADELAFSFIENSFERNRPGLVPSLFELMDIPYAGSDPYAHMVTSDKKLFQEICCCINLQCPRSLEIRSDTRKEEIKDKIQNYNFSFPLVLKYRYGTMSCGLSIVETVEHLLAESERLLAEEKDSSVLCQEYIPGHEVTVPIIGTGENARVLSVIEYTGPKGEPLRTYDMRWKNELDELIQLIPFKQGSASSQQIRQECLRLYRHLGLRDMSRIDLRVTDTGKIYFLEANCIPSLGYDGAFDPASYGGNISFDEVILEIIHSAQARWKGGGL